MRCLQAARGATLNEHADPATDGPAAPQRPRRAALLLSIAAVALVVDVLTKVWVVAELEGQRVIELVEGGPRLAVSRNPGAAFSFAEGATLLFTAVAVVVVVVILRSARRLRSRGWAWSLGLLLGGASGNLVDRLLRSPGPGRGAVVDFLDLRVWPVFNVADSCIVVGGVLAVVLSLRGIELDGTRTVTGGRHARRDAGTTPSSGGPSGTMGT